MRAVLHTSWLGRCNYEPTWQAMQDLTQTRDQSSPDQLWLLDHPPVYTQGQAGKPEHLLLTGNIPVVQSDRGGQVTYHGPGQLVGYLLVDIDRLGISTRHFVEAVEDGLTAAVRSFGIDAIADRSAHGVYVSGRKIASIGMRIRRGCSYHGFSVNVDMDLSPFRGINPCGYAGLSMCQLRDFAPAQVNLMAQARAAAVGGLQQYLPQLDFRLSPTG